MDYTNFLVLYSGGADSTYFIEKEESAKHLIHFAGQNEEQKKVAIINANNLNRFLTIIDKDILLGMSRDGETNQIHSLYDSEMLLRASIIALSYGMKGIVACFNKKDIGVDIDSLEKIVKRVDKDFQILFPLKDHDPEMIRKELGKKQIRYISCMHSINCGYCAKCLKKY